MARNFVLYEGQTITIPGFFGGDGDYQGGRIYDVPGTAERGKDYASINIILPPQTVYDGQLGGYFSLHAYEDDVKEADETLSVISFDFDNEGGTFSYETYNFIIKDKPEDCVFFLDENGDGIAERFEYSAHTIAAQLQYAHADLLALNSYYSDMVEKMKYLGDAFERLGHNIVIDALNDVLFVAQNLIGPSASPDRFVLKEVNSTGTNGESVTDYVYDVVSQGGASKDGLSLWLSVQSQFGKAASLAAKTVGLTLVAKDLEIAFREWNEAARIYREELPEISDRIEFLSEKIAELSKCFSDAGLAGRLGAPFALTALSEGPMTIESDGGMKVRTDVADYVFIDGTFGDDVSTFTMTGGVNTIIGLQSGNDTLHIDGLGSGILDGGAGFDTLCIEGDGTFYLLWSPASGGVVTNGAITAQIVNFEKIIYQDGVVRLDVDGHAGAAYRLYQAAFERAPDNDGLKYWIGRLDDGDTTLAAIAESFLNSPEYIRTYGTEETVSNAHFIDLLYTHTLGRDYDQDGYNYWVERLDAGATNRRDLLAYFSESDENKTRVADAIDDGIWLT